MSDRTTQLRQILETFAVATHETKPGQDESRNFDAALSQLEAVMESERKDGQLEILMGFRKRDFVRDNFYQSAVIDRIAALRPPAGDREAK